MHSLKNEQNQAMNDINALLNKRDVQENLLTILNEKIGLLAHVHAKMQETESFIVQLANAEIANIPNIADKINTDKKSEE